MTIFLEYYMTSRGENPIYDYIMSIDNVEEVAEIFETLESIDQNGARHLVSGAEITRPLGDGLWEIKKGQHRLFYIYCIGNRVYLLHACLKQKQKTEAKDLQICKKRMREIQAKEITCKKGDNHGKTK